MSSNDTTELNLLAEGDNILPSDYIASQTVADLENELKKFRLEWKKELQEEKKKDSSQFLNNFDSKSTDTNEVSKLSKNVAVYQQFPQRNRVQLGKQPVSDKTELNDLDYQQPKTNEEKAQYLFNKGVILEQQSRHFEAIKFYRMAMQLDADIEFKMVSTKLPKNQAETKTESDNNDKNQQEETLSEDLEKPLYQIFKQFIHSENKLCEKSFPQKATHFSNLPYEVVILILKWVVSEHLDMRSLDNFAATCKGFYVCGRDPEIWKLACAKIWGLNNIKNYLPMYSDWRQMYLNRPRLNFDGVYICKTTYAREGERSLDNFYKPWHLVEFFRYLRFLPDGTVLFLTSPDEPKIVVAKLKQPHSSSNQVQNFYNQFISNEQSIIKGKWTLTLNKVYLVLVKKTQVKNTLTVKTGRKKEKETVQEQEHVYRIELELNSKMNNQLHWKKYEIDTVNKSSNSINVAKFDLNKIDFPNFYFSRVKSYSLSTDAPLK